MLHYNVKMKKEFLCGVGKQQRSTFCNFDTNEVLLRENIMDVIGILS